MKVYYDCNCALDETLLKCQILVLVNHWETVLRERGEARVGGRSPWRPTRRRARPATDERGQHVRSWYKNNIIIIYGFSYHRALLTNAHIC